MSGSTCLAWAVVILFAVLSIVLLMGKGSFLLAGYNTASKKEKSKYNEKRLCRVVGGGLINPPHRIVSVPHHFLWLP